VESRDGTEPRGPAIYLEGKFTQLNFMLYYLIYSATAGIPFILVRTSEEYFDYLVLCIILYDISI
jgi:hypothetical protein